MTFDLPLTCTVDNSQLVKRTHDLFNSKPYKSEYVATLCVLQIPLDIEKLSHTYLISDRLGILHRHGHREIRYRKFAV